MWCITPHVKRDARQLSPEQQEVLQLTYFGGLTQAEVANRLGQPLGTVKARIRRGVKTLRERMVPTLLAQ